MPKKAKARSTTIVIRRDETVEAAHHGGAWKVAYADFVTAMMAFFLLMWLINATTEKQRRGLADYFSPVGPPTRSTSGNGKPFGGLTPNEIGSMVSNRGFVNNTDQSGRPPPDEQPAPETIEGSQPQSIDRSSGRQGASSQAAAKAAARDTDPDAIPVDGDSDRPGASGRADAQADADADASPATIDAPPATSPPAAPSKSVLPEPVPRQVPAPDGHRPVEPRPAAFRPGRPHH